MKKLLYIGDSHVQALGPRVREALGERYDVTTVAHAGKSSRWFAEGPLEEALARYEPDIVVLSLGGNDAIWGERSHEGYVREILAQVWKANAIPLWVGPFYATRDDVAERHNETGDRLRFWLGNYGVPYLDGRPISQDATLRSDGVHFSFDEAGYGHIARHISDWILRDPERAYGRKLDDGARNSAVPIVLGLASVAALFFLTRA